jgi:hypothetical protein
MNLPQVDVFVMYFVINHLLKTRLKCIAYPRSSRHILAALFKAPAVYVGLPGHEATFHIRKRRPGTLFV